MIPKEQNIFRMLAFMVVYNTLRVCHKIFKLENNTCE